MLPKVTRILRSKDLTSWLAAAAICISLWVVLAIMPSTNRYVPTPLSVGKAIIDNSSVLTKHLRSTTISATSGFIVGSGAAILLSFISITFVSARKPFTLLSMALYSVPLIAAAPLAALLFGTNMSGAVLGCIGSFLPVFLAGLRAGDRASILYGDVVRVHGSTSWDEIKHVRLPLIVRGWIVGAQSGWIWAVLGALLGDFTGGRWGLGVFLVGSLSRGEPSRAWAIVVLCLALSSIGLLIIVALGKLMGINGRLDPIDTSLPNPLNHTKGKCRRLTLNVLYISVFVLIWQSVAWATDYHSGIFTGPLSLVQLGLNIVQGHANITLHELLSCLGSTVLLSCIGVAISLATAFIVAAGRHFIPFISRSIILPLLITQVTPIVAFVPAISYYMGRGSASVITIVVLSTVYPSYIVFLKAFEDVPSEAIDLVHGFGGGVFSDFTKVRLPHAAWMSVIAFRLAVGRALLGAITAEYLVTGTGIGGILGQTRALLDFQIVWFLCIVIAVLSLCFDSIIVIFERLLWPQKMEDM